MTKAQNARLKKLMFPFSNQYQRKRGIVKYVNIICINTFTNERLSFISQYLFYAQQLYKNKISKTLLAHIFTLYAVIMIFIEHNFFRNSYLFIVPNTFFIC